MSHLYETNNNYNKVAVVIDSGVDLPIEYEQKSNVFKIPLRIIFKNKEYKDGIDISVDEILEKMKQEIPSTSLPTAKDILDIIYKIKNEGYKKIIFITISSELSGTHTIIKNTILNEGINDLNISIIDTKNISVGSGLIAVKLLDYLDNNTEEDISLKELKKLANNYIDKVKFFFTVGDIKYLKKGGRINTFAATISTILNIKPIITCDKQGKYILDDKARGKNKSYDKLLSKLNLCMENNETRDIFIIYGDNFSIAKDLKTKIINNISNVNVRIFIKQISAALIVHTGGDALGIGSLSI